MPLILKIDVTKIDKKHIYHGAKGKYLELVVMENRDGPGKYGDTHMVVQGVTKEARDAGERGAILGNGKMTGQPQRQAEPRREDRQSNDWQDNDQIPF